MKFINKYLAFAAVLALLFSSCSKDENTVPADDPSVQSVDLTFGAVLNDLANRAAQVNKSHFDDIPDCSTADPAYVELEISYPGQSAESMGVITIDILSEGGDFFTDYSEKLKIPVPNDDEVMVTLKSFIVFDAQGNRIWIAPIAPENDPDLYEGYVEKPLEFEFSVQDGTKPYIDVEVLCYDRRMANEYGYVFFDIVPEKIYPYCLFINYCDEDGRHFVANYSVDLYYGPDDTGIQLYDGISLDDIDDADYGIVDDNYYSDPLCLVVPGKPNALGAEDPYLFLVIYPNDWDGNYGDIDNSPIEVQLSWNDVNGLLNNDGTTNEYDHILIGECEGALTGDGSGGNGGGTGDNDLDDDGVTNDVDQCPNTPEGVDVNNVGCPDSDGDGVFDNEDNCPNEAFTTDEDGDGCEDETSSDCEWNPEQPVNSCFRTTLNGEGDSFLEITLDTGIPLIEEGEIVGAGTLGVTLTNSGLEYTFDIGSATIAEYDIQVRDSSGGVIACADENDVNSTVEGAFSYPIYMRASVNVCEPDN